MATAPPEEQQPRAEEQPPKPSDELEDAPEVVKVAADADNGLKAESVTVRDEEEALNYLLGAAGKQYEHEVEVVWDTDDGERTLLWKFNSLPGSTIESIEKEHMLGGGFGQIDQYPAAAELVARATTSPDVKSERFRTPREATETNPDRKPDADPADALKRAFQYQSGTLVTLAQEIKRKSGYGGDRVGMAKRALVRAAGNSSS